RACARGFGLSLVCAIACTRPRRDNDAHVSREAAPSLRTDSVSGVRGVTIGPIENALHPDVGYGTAAYSRQLDDCARMGASWIALTPFGRVADLSGTGV